MGSLKLLHNHSSIRQDPASEGFHPNAQSGPMRAMDPAGNLREPEPARSIGLPSSITTQTHPS
jgi:hypothetical protein